MVHLANPVPEPRAAGPSLEDPGPRVQRPRRIASFAWPPSLRSQGVAPPTDTDLLAAVSAGRDDRVLVIGESGADLLCDALRRGCRGASAFRDPPAHPEPVDVVVAPTIRAEEAAQAAASCARRALPAGGRLALRMLGAGARAMARAVAARLRNHGFVNVRLLARPEGMLLTCHLGSLGHSATGRAF